MTLALFPGLATFDSLAGQYFTRPEEARLVALTFGAHLRGRRVLEPSAGSGSLVRAALDAGATSVIAIERDVGWCAELRARFASEPVTVLEGDFLAIADGWLADGVAPTFDVVLGNPPYNDGLDTEHLSRIVRLSDAISIIRTTALAGKHRRRRVWNQCRLAEVGQWSDRPAFDCASGDGGKIDLCVVRTERGLPNGTPASFFWIDEVRA